MKLRNIILMAAIASAAIALTTACGGSKKTSALGEKVETPCNDSDYKTNSKTFRGTGIGTSQDQSTAKTKARLDANRNLAESINVTIKAVTDRYTNEVDVSSASDFERKFEDLTRQVVNQEMNNVAVVCQEMRLKDGKYTCYMATEVDKDALLNNIRNTISNDSKLRVDYDKQKFEKIFNEEMRKLQQEHQF